MGWRYDQHEGVVWLVDDVLSNENASLNCFAQADFIGEKVSLNRICKHATNNVDLMLQEFNSSRRETTKAAEPGALTSQATHDLGAAIEKTGSIGDASSQVVCGIGDWA